MLSNSSESSENMRRRVWAWLSRRLRNSWVTRPTLGDGFELGVFMTSLAAFMVVVPFRGFDSIIGDNIAQVGYWRILGDHRFVGSLGAASMKPGLIVLLGAAHDLSQWLFGSAELIKVVFALAAAGLTTIVARIAREGGGKIAGLGAITYMLTKTPVPEMFVDGTSMIVFFPLLLWGVWLFTRRSDTVGAIVLCLAAMIRIEAFAVLLWLALAQQLFKRRFRAFAISTFVVSIAVALTILVYYRLQGSVARFNAGGPPAGYIFSHEPSAWVRLLSAIKYPFTAGVEMLFVVCGSPYLAVPALLGGALSPGRRSYLALLGIPSFLVVYVGAGQGYGEVRYLQFLAPAVSALGALGIAHAFRIGRRASAPPSFWWCLALGLGGALCIILGAPKPVGSLALIFIAVGLGALAAKLPQRRARQLGWGWALLFWVQLLDTIAHNSWQTGSKPAPYTVDAIDLVKHNRVPSGQRVLTEDDVIYGVLVRDKKFFRRVSALQYFNVQDDAGRAKILRSTDYIALSKHNFVNYYLKYDPFGRGDTDPFRAAMVHARKGRATSLYGFRLLPIETSRAWTVIKVEPEPAPG